MFHTSKIRNRSEMVYPENLSSGALVDEHMSSMDFDSDYADSEMEWEEELLIKVINQVMTHASMMFKF